MAEERNFRSPENIQQRYYIDRIIENSKRNI